MRVADSAAINGHRRRGERNAIPPYKDFTAAFNIQRRSGQKRSIPPYKDFTAAINNQRRSGERNAIPPYKDFTARSELFSVDPILLLKYFWVNNRHIFI